MKEYQTKGNKGILPIRIQGYFPNPDNTVMDIITGRTALNLLGITSSRPPGASHLPQWKKPERQVILDPSKASKKQTSKTTGPSPIIETPKRGKYVPIPREAIDLGYDLPTPGQFTAPKMPEAKPTKFSFTYPTGEYNQQKTMYFPSKSALKSFTEGVRGATYQEGNDYATATGNLQDGGDLTEDSFYGSLIGGQNDQRTQAEDEFHRGPEEVQVRALQQAQLDQAAGLGDGVLGHGGHIPMK